MKIMSVLELRNDESISVRLRNGIWSKFNNEPDRLIQTITNVEFKSIRYLGAGSFKEFSELRGNGIMHDIRKTKHLEIIVQLKEDNSIGMFSTSGKITDESKKAIIKFIKNL